MMDKLPNLNVKEYIEYLANLHNISDECTNLDRWAEAVSGASGDSVQLDRIGRLLTKLKQKEVISGTEMANLMTKYLSEKGQI